MFYQWKTKSNFRIVFSEFKHVLDSNSLEIRALKHLNLVTVYLSAFLRGEISQMVNGLVLNLIQKAFAFCLKESINLNYMN